MPGRFERWVGGWRLAFNGPNFRAFFGGLAAVVDRLAGEALQAAREATPSLAEDEASFGLFGRDVGIERGPTETLASYQVRLAHQVAQNKLHGTSLGLLCQLHWLGFPGAVVVQQNGYAHSLTSDPSAPDLTAALAAKSKPSWYQIEELGPNPAIPASTDGKPAIAAGTIPWWTFGDPMDAEGNQYNSRFGLIWDASATDPDLGTAANLARLRRVVRKWRAGKSRCVVARVITSGHYWGEPGLLWGAGGLVWGGTSTSYAVE